MVRFLVEVVDDVVEVGFEVDASGRDLGKDGGNGFGGMV